ncbi:hypothetical protein IIU_05887 [Bacillus cereus VD133]|uniref:Heparan-alpha-glucosaminide N-acetyltransferase catalytic domain-containing protein n=1 Tax=Bacillus cereus VD133 TaxID=1053233 RepID=A0A9W5PLC8_BACCE|nr:hypothetical protein IIU_05887 [Bacillus cereus VD133]
MNIEMNDNRIDVIDYLRGFALMGILLINIFDLLNIKLPSPHSIDTSYQRLLLIFVESRMYTIFTFLFGMSFYIFITRAKEKSNNGYLLFIRRLIILSIIGNIHITFFPGEVLALYARWGFFLLPFYKVKR